MIGIDTNVLVRMLVPDDRAQTDQARHAIVEAEDAREPILINDVVLAETMWTMQRRYKAPRGELLDIAKGLLDATAFAFEERADFEEAVRLFEQSAADFSDCLIVAKNKSAGCRITLTFDAQCAKLPSATGVASVA